MNTCICICINMHKYSDDYKNRMSIKGNIVVCDTGPKAPQYAVVVVVVVVVVLVVVYTRGQFKFEPVALVTKQHQTRYNV